MLDLPQAPAHDAPLDLIVERIRRQAAPELLLLVGTRANGGALQLVPASHQMVALA
jgi:hypothetical protein